MTIKRALKLFYGRIPFKQRLFEPLRHLGVPEPVYRHLHFIGPFYVPIDSRRGFWIEHRGTIVENELFWSGIGGGWEGNSNRIWAALCERQSGFVLDVGANTGVYSLIAAAVADSRATIVAFEPIARIVELLQRNANLNGGRVLIEDIAASDSDSVATIYDFEGDIPYSASIERPFPGSDRAYEIRTRRLDSFLAQHSGSRIAACKIDVEGHEAAVIRGMQHAIAQWKPPLLIEILDEASGRKIEELIDGTAYQRWNIDENRGLIRSETLRPLGSHNWNVLLCTAPDFDDRGLSRFLASKNRA